MKAVMITMPTLIKLLATTILASKRLGISNSRMTVLLFLLLELRNDSSSAGVREKKAVSAPETIALDTSNNNTANIPNKTCISKGFV